MAFLFNTKVLIVIFAYFFYERNQLFNVINQYYNRYTQIDKCLNWCEQDVLFGIGTFSESAKIKCKNKCYKFFVLPPLVDYICKVGCKPFDIFLNGKCNDNAFCVYYRDVNSVSIKEGVKSKWLMGFFN